MGDYYKFKKILIILMIISCGFSIIKNIFKTNVKASEIVNPKEVSNGVTIQYDNTFYTLQELEKNFQDNVYLAFVRALSNESTRANAINTLQVIYNHMTSSQPNEVMFFENNQSGSATFFFIRCFPITALNSNNINNSGITYDASYNFPNVPWLVYNRSYTYPTYAVDFNCNIFRTDTTGTHSAPIPMLGVYTDKFVDLFMRAGIIKNNLDYNNILQSIEETNELNYSQNYYTRELVENTYNSINNSNVNNITSTGITQPSVNEPDLSQAFDSITDLLTNDNATTKTFTFTLPNNDSFNFSLDPNFLRTSLTRVGGSSLVTIIETLWYIGLYGLFIFTYLKILGALLAGDLDNVTGVLSPVNSVVSSSLEVTGAFRTSGGDDAAFRFRKG